MSDCRGKSGRVTRATSRLPLLALALAIAFTLTLTVTAGAKPLIGRDGQIHACYRVKGKPKGELRVVKSARAHCRRGERKVAWTAAGALAAAGAPGQQGSAGVGGSVASTSALEAKVASLTTRVESLEGVLAGLTNAALLEAVSSVPVVKSLCTQATVLTTRANALLSSLAGTVLAGTIPLGLGLTIPGLPASSLPDYTCP